MRQVSVAEHYDLLIDEGDDPVKDPPALRAYMERWDGAPFIEALCPDRADEILEIGVGTGRLAARVAPLCGGFTGIDVSPKTIARAAENLAGLQNVTLICGDFCNSLSKKSSMPCILRSHFCTFGPNARRYKRLQNS